MSAVPDALAELDDIAAHGVELLSQPVEQSRMYWRVRQDPYIALSLL
jgi:hypothetical protein